MKCPVCDGVSLVMSERSGIEIDYCPTCRGVWLDRGELDKLIERAATAAPTQPPAYGNASGQTSEHERGYNQQPHSQSHDPNYQQGGYYKKKKREGFLSELFDFD